MATEENKILISSRSFGKINSGAVEILNNAHLKSNVNPFGRKLNEEELIDLLDGAVGIIAGTENISEKVILNANQLRVISRYGVGLDNIDLKTAKQKGVLVYNTPETPSVAVAELTLSLILNLLKKIGKVDRQIRDNIWKPEIGNLLSGKTIGIIGLGRVGRKLVQFLEPFDLKILAHDMNPDKTFVTKYNINLLSLNSLISISDVITLHIPLTEKTKYIIGEKELKMMKKNAILVNTARGGLINEEALYNSLREKRTAGAAIDAFENEPNIGKLKELDTVILTPHIGTYTVETRKHMEIEAANNLINGLKKAGIL